MTIAGIAVDASHGRAATLPALIIGSGIVLGVLVYLFVEKPMLRRINAWIDARRRETAPANG